MVRSDLLAKFASDGVKKQWRIVADDGTVITNDVIVDGSVQLQEPLNTSEQLEFGSCESACFSFQIYERTRLKNKILTVYVTLDNMPEMQVGVYKVDSDKLTANRKMRDIVAYDKLHEILDADVKEWYNTILPNLDTAVSLKQFRESFLRHFNLTFDEENLISDTLTIHKTLDASETAELKGSAILPGICQLNAAFGHIRRDGSFAFVTLPPHQTETSFGLQNGAPYMEDPTYEEYDVQVIDKVVIRESDSGTETATTYTSDYTTAIPDSDHKKYSALTVYNSKAAEYIALKEAKEAELEQVNVQLRVYEQGGNAVLTNRKKVSAAKMSAAGWSAFNNASADDYATVYSSTYSNAGGSKAGNFTPIETDRNTGDLRTIFTPAQLDEYAQAVIDGTSEDWRNLQIGSFFYSGNGNTAVGYASIAAEAIHTLSEQQMGIRDALDEARSAYLKDCTNAFIIEDNFLIYDATAEQRDAIAEQIYNKVHGIYYRPFELKAPGNLCYEVGDSIKIETKYDVIDTYILERSFSGTGHCEDTYNARGTEKRNEQVASVSDQVEKLNGRYARLKKNIDGISSEVGKRISEKDTEIRSWVNQRFDGFEAGVTEDNIVEKLNQAMSSVTIRANGIDFNSTGSFTANTKNFIVDAAGNVEINSLDAQATITGARIWASEITSSDQYSGNSTIIRDGFIQTNQIYLGSGGEFSQLSTNGLFMGGSLNNHVIISPDNLVFIKNNDTTMLSGLYGFLQLPTYKSVNNTVNDYSVDLLIHGGNSSVNGTYGCYLKFATNYNISNKSIPAGLEVFYSGDYNRPRLTISEYGIIADGSRTFSEYLIKTPSGQSITSSQIFSTALYIQAPDKSRMPNILLSAADGYDSNSTRFSFNNKLTPYALESSFTNNLSRYNQLVFKFSAYEGLRGTMRDGSGSRSNPYTYTDRVVIDPANNVFRFGAATNMVSAIDFYGTSVKWNDSIILTAANNWKYSYRLYREEAVNETESRYGSVYISKLMNFRPDNDNVLSCGTTLAGWTDVYAYNGVTQPSDERAKTNITNPNTKYLDFIKNVEPKTYKYKKGQSGRTHLGFIAQDIETLLSKCGIETYEFAGFVKTPIMSEEEPDAIEDFSYSLRYGEFIPLLLMYIKDNERRIKELEERLNGAV